MPPSRSHCRARLRAVQARPVLRLQVLGVASTGAGRAASRQQGSQASASNSEAGSDMKRIRKPTSGKERCRIVAFRRDAVPISAQRSGRVFIICGSAARRTWSSSHRCRGAPRRTNMPVPGIDERRGQAPAVPVGRTDLHVPVRPALSQYCSQSSVRQCAEMQHAAAEPRQVAQRRCGLARAEVLQHVVADHEVERSRRGEGRTRLLHPAVAFAQVRADLEPGVAGPRKMRQQRRRASGRGRSPRRGSSAPATRRAGRTRQSGRRVASSRRASRPEFSGST